MELGGELGPHDQQIHPSIQFKSKVLKVYSHLHFAPHKTPMGANKITQITPACFFITFVTVFWEIFLEYSWNIFQKGFQKIVKFENIIFILLY
jgi:hypothetical protein